jgi:hypothetical protein
MNHPFSVTCYKNDIGIFTVYGARIKQRKNTYPYSPKAIHNIPVPRDPRFIDKIFYEVVLFTNPELSQSVTCYQAKDKNKAEVFLNNFIELCSKDYRYIDLSRIPDTPLKKENYSFDNNETQPKKDYYKINKNDSSIENIPDSDIDPRYINDPRTNPFYDVFDNISKEPRYTREPKHYYDNPPYYNEIDEIDYNKQPKRDGEIMSFTSDNKPSMTPINPYDYPYYNEEIFNNKIHVVPEPKKEDKPFIFPVVPPPVREKIIVYYGNGGFAMGESVISNIKEISPSALRVMLSKNYHSTFTNMNPRDNIVVKKGVLDCILPDATFKTNMDIAGEWSFFMIPDKFYKLVEDFNWYYKEDTIDGTWFELDKTIPQTTFTVQDNGVRYYVNAVRLNGRYDMRFAKSGVNFNNEASEGHEEVDNRDLNIDMKYVVSVNIENFAKNEYSATIEDLSVTNQVIRNLNSFIHDEIAWQAIENHVYELKVYSKDDKTTPLITVYFIAIPDDNYKHGFCTWVSDSYNDSIAISDQFVKVIEVDGKPLKTPSATDRIIIKEEDVTTTDSVEEIVEETTDSNSSSEVTDETSSKTEETEDIGG